MKLIKQVNFKICVIYLTVLSAAVANAQIPEDKKLHFAAGALAGATGYTYVWQKTKDKKKAMLAGIGTALLAGTAKELFDATESRNKFDTKDLAATALLSLIHI